MSSITRYSATRFTQSCKQRPYQCCMDTAVPSEAHTAAWCRLSMTPHGVATRYSPRHAPAAQHIAILQSCPRTCATCNTKSAQRTEKAAWCGSGCELLPQPPPAPVSHPNQASALLSISLAHRRGHDAAPVHAPCSQHPLGRQQRSTHTIFSASLEIWGQRTLITQPLGPHS